MTKGKHTEAEMIGALKQVEAGRTAEQHGDRRDVSHTLPESTKRRADPLDSPMSLFPTALHNISQKIKPLAPPPRGRKRCVC